VFKIAKALVIDHRSLNGGHVKFKIKQDKDVLDCIWFKHTLADEDLDRLTQSTVNLYGQIEINEYLGQKKLQFMVHNLTTA
jgi:tRNA(Ile2) C34 agmatinyltransferase TiaS